MITQVGSYIPSLWTSTSLQGVWDCLPRLAGIAQRHPYALLAAVGGLALVGLLRDARPDKSIPYAHTPWPLLGNLVDIARDAARGVEVYSMLEAAEKASPHWVSVPNLHGLYLRISDPPSIRTFLEDIETFQLPSTRKVLLGELFGSGIFVSNGEAWSVQRNLAKPIFAFGAREEMFGSYHTALHHLLGLLEQAAALKQSLELQDLFKRFTLDTFCEIGFGYPVHALQNPLEFSSSFDYILKEAYLRIKFPWRKLLYGRQWKHHMGLIEGFIHRMITERRREGWKGRKDYLSTLLEMEEQKEQTGVSEKFLRDQLMNFVVAGRDTTAVLLSATFYFLAQYPDVEAKVIEEVDRVMGKEKATLNHTKELRYLKNVLDESMRLFPPAVPLNTRICTKDVILPNKAKVPKGYIVGYSPFVVHRLKAYWGEDAEEFHPERWENGELLKHPYQFVPFQKGPRQCLGMNMAYEEAKCCIATIYQHGFRFKLVKTENPILHQLSAVLLAKNGIHVTVFKK